jgi:predicted ABC-type ATPase
MDAKLKIVIIAGPNGAGKTTFAKQFLPQEAGCPDFINVDLIAAGLSPFDPDAAALKAGRLVLSEIRSRVRQKHSFAFETTLSGVTYARMIPAWQRAGYYVKLIFLSLVSPELATARVRARVAQGGHAVPEPVIRRRFAAGLRNFRVLYKALADAWVLYDNSGDELRLIEAGTRR